MRHCLPYLALAAVGVAADQFTKWLVFEALDADRPVLHVFGDVITLVERRNTGGVFGVFPGSSALFTVLSLLALVLIAVLMWKWLSRDPHIPVGLALAAVLAGAIGNLIDRFWLGEVRDFINFRVGSYTWPTFNVADIFITVGAIALVVLMAFTPAKDAQREGR